MVLQRQQRFKSERHNVFTDEINKIALINLINDQMIIKIQSIDSIETYAYGTRKDVVSDLAGCSKNYQTKFYVLFYCENSKQTRISRNCI